MARISGNWLTGNVSGSPCKHDGIYAKVNKKTGKCYAVKLCNPYEGEPSAAQTAQKSAFGNVASALASWINTNKVSTAAGYSAYLQVKEAFDRQSKYSSLRGYMMAKNYAVNGLNGVTITVGSYSTTVTPGSGSGGSNYGPHTVTLTASPAAGGTVTGGGSNIAHGSSVTISAVANSGYNFTKWSDNNTQASRTLTVNDNVTLQAIFTLQGGGMDE